MDDDSGRATRAHLVEDVILTLGNIRAALGWIRAEDVPEHMRDIALDRIEREIAALEDRAIVLRPERGQGPLILRDPLPPEAEMPHMSRRAPRLGHRARVIRRASQAG